MRLLALLTTVVMIAACERADPRPGERASAADASPRNADAGSQPLEPCDSSFQLEPINYATDPDAQAERALLARAPEDVGRDGADLRLRLANGQTKRFRDCRAEGDQYRRYLFVGFGPRRESSLVEARYYEGGTIRWIDASTGADIALLSRPVFSRDSSYFAVANVDLDAGYTRNGMEVWFVHAGSATPVLQLDGGESWGAEAAIWENDSTIRYTHVSAGTEPGHPRTEVRRLTMRAREWMADSSIR